MTSQVYSDPREDRLKNEWKELQELNQQSETVHVEPINQMPGSQPDEYRITLRCKGILRIDGSNNPVFGNLHTVLMKCDDGFPNQPPALHWETDIWHPNIDHQRKSVCINAAEWVGCQSLVDVCRKLFEMAQYKSYHALAEPPYPLDHTVAEWVLRYAEPSGLIDKRRNLAIDNRPLYRPTAPVSLAVRSRIKEVTVPREPLVRLVQTRVRAAAATSVPQSVGPTIVPTVAPNVATPPVRSPRIRMAGLG